MQHEGIVYPEPEIIWEDSAYLIVNKPGGLLTQAPPGIDSMELRVRRYLLRRENRTGNIYVTPCHRLDRPASGLLAFARNVRAARRLAEQFQDRTVLKLYWAIVEGEIIAEAGSWTDFMRKIPGEARSEIVPAEHSDAQFASLSYRCKAKSNHLSLLEIELETGRTHQIRLQAASRGFPVIGDELYGAKRPFGPQTPDLRQRWIGLLAKRLRFVHPQSKETIDLAAPAPPHWIDV